MAIAAPTSSSHRLPFWVVTAYFAEGLPYSLVRLVSPVFFKDAGASLEAIGLTSLHGLPWAIKFAWAPLLDAFATKRLWVVAMEWFMAGLGLVLAAGSLLPGARTAMGLFFLLAGFAAATHDIAVDGFYLEALDRAEQSRWVGFQAMSFRLALIAGGGGLVFFSSRTSWWAAFALAALSLGVIAAFHQLALPRGEIPGRPMADLLRFEGMRAFWLCLCAAGGLAGTFLLGWNRPPLARYRRALTAWAGGFDWTSVVATCSLLVLVFLALGLPLLKRRLASSPAFYARAFVDYLGQPRAGVILVFLISYRLGESCLLAMVYPFLSDIGIDRGQYGIAYGTVGISATIAGAIAGGWLISRFGLRRMIWPLALAQNLPNVLYMLLAFRYQAIANNRAAWMLFLAGDWNFPMIRCLDAACEWLGRPELYAADYPTVIAAVALEALGTGLGIAAFMVFIMRTCQPRFKAAHMAIGTGVMNVAATLGGVFSGFLAARLGFPLFFAFTFVASIPGMICIAFLPELDVPACSPPNGEPGAHPEKPG